MAGTERAPGTRGRVSRGAGRAHGCRRAGFSQFRSRLTAASSLARLLALGKPQERLRIA